MSFTSKFTLKQHTPLIHFQHAHRGATLRPTELKAKLDQFLITKIPGIDPKKPLEKLINDPNYCDFLVGGKNAKHAAFDYKVFCKDLDNNPVHGSTSIITEKDLGHWIKSIVGIQIEFFSFQGDLLNLITDHIREFFACTNFGKRQSKGWGSYYLSNNELDFEAQLRNSGKVVYKWNQPIINSGALDGFYTTIKNRWRLLKSGTNYPYKKALIFDYGASKNIRWDKRLMKKDINSLIEGGKLKYNLKGNKFPVDITADPRESYNDWDDNDEINGKYRFLRAMLGLPELYEFQADGSHLHQVSFTHKEIKEKKIDRFKSPVTFKIFNNALYAIVEGIPNEFFGQTFNAKVRTKKGENEVIGLVDMPSDYITPMANEFNLVAFLDKYLTGFNKI